MEVERLVDEGGEEWDAVAAVICEKLCGVPGIERGHIEMMKKADNVGLRMWFLGVAFYVLDTDLGEDLSVQTRYFLDHFYEYCVYTSLYFGDVYMNMRVLRDRMNEAGDLQ